MVDTPSERKERVLRELVEARTAIEHAALGLTGSKEHEVFLGQWSCLDIVAHLIGWDHTNIAATSELLDGRLPSFYADHDADWRSYNARLVKRYRGPDLQLLLRKAEASHHELLALLDSLPSTEIIRDRGLKFRGWRVTIERLMLAEAKDEREHARQLAEFAGRRTATAATSGVPPVPGPR